MDKIAVLVPCYNEAQSVAKVVTDFRRVLPECTVYVYDNNSTDGTAELAQAAGAVVRREYRQGKGHVIRRMFREIDAECYIMVDGDDTYPAECAPALAAPVLEQLRYFSWKSEMRFVLRAFTRSAPKVSLVTYTILNSG